MYDAYDYGYEEPAVWPWYLLGGIIILIISCLLANTFQSLWKRISPDLRTMTPELAWLIIIPIFGVIWMMYLIYQLGHALKEEFKRKEIVEFETTPGLGIGWAFSFALLTGQLVSFIDEPVLTAILLATSVALLIIFWIRLAGFQSKLEQVPPLGFHQQPPHAFQPPPHPFPQAPPPPQQQHYPPYYPPQQNYPPPPQQFPPPQQDNEWDRWKPK